MKPSLADAMPISTELLRRSSNEDKLKALQRFAYTVSRKTGSQPLLLSLDRRWAVGVGAIYVDMDKLHEYDGHIDNGLAAAWGWVARVQGVRYAARSFLLAADPQLAEKLSKLSDCYVQLIELCKSYAGLPECIAVSLLPPQSNLADIASDSYLAARAGCLEAVTRLMFTGAVDPLPATHKGLSGGLLLTQLLDIAKSVQSNDGKKIYDAYCKLFELLPDSSGSEGGESSNEALDGMEDMPAQTKAGGWDNRPNTTGADLVVPSTAITSSRHSDLFHEHFTDERHVMKSGGYTGIPKQLHRIVTDLKVMARRELDIMPPKAVVGVTIDLSYSMATQIRGGSRLEVGRGLHDLMISGLHEVGVEYFSFGYGESQREGSLFKIINPEGQMTMLSAGSASIMTNNNDIAMVQRLLRGFDSSPLAPLAIIIADGEFGSSEFAYIQREFDERGITAIHVDMGKNRYSPFGGIHIKVNEMSEREVITQVAIALRECLGMG